MGVVLTGRQRLRTGVVAGLVVAVAAGWFTDQAQAQRRGQAQAIVQCDTPNLSRVSYFSSDSAAIQLARRTAERTDADVATLSLARDSCRNELVDGRRRHNVDAYACVATMQLRIARQSRTEPDYNQAYCANQAVITLANRANQPAKAAQAHQDNGDVLMALRDINNPNSTRGSELLNQAIVSYREAVRQPNAARHFALGRALTARGDTAGATEQMQLGAQARPANAAEARDAIRALVSLAGGDPAPSNATTLLERARALDEEYRGAERPSMAVNAALGLRYAAANNPNANARIQDAVGGRNDLADYPGRNYLADAHYYLALQDARTGNWTRALARGQDALRAGGSTDPKFGRLVCIAYIARGWTRDTEDTTACAVDTTSPQGELLNMMYRLRRAQYINVRDASGRYVINLQGPARERYQAEMIGVIQAYDRANVATANWTPEQRQNALADWPGAASLAPANRDIRDMMAFARWIAAHECPGGPPLPEYRSEAPDGIRARGRAFFGMYGLASCRAS